MANQFSQPDKILNVQGNKQAIARICNVKVSAVAYLANTLVTDTYSIFYEKSTQTIWRGNAVTGTVISWAIAGTVMTLLTSLGTFTLNQFVVTNSIDIGNNTGASAIGTSNGLTVQAMLNRLDVFVKPETYGMVGNAQASAHANSLALYNTLEALRTAGGGVLFLTPNTTYWVDFINFIPSNVVILGNNATIKHVDPTSAYGRGGLVVGSSREWSYDVAKAAYIAGTYPVSVLDSTVNDLGQGVYLRDNQSALKAENVIIHDLRMEAYFSSPTLWGGYAINVVNAQHVQIHNLRTLGWTQAFNVGNDSLTSCPSSHDVNFYNVIVEQADLVRSYYALGFIANSTSSGISGGTLLVPMTADSTNGSGIATNFCEDITIRDIFIKDLGLTVSSEGILLNNTKGSLVENIDIRNCINVVATYYTVDSYNDLAAPNIIRNVSGQGRYIIALRAKYAHIESFEAYGVYTGDIYFGNNNASGNVINKMPKLMVFGGSNSQAWFMQNNTVEGWIRKYFYLRPIDILLNDKSTLQNWNDNITVATSAANATFMWRVPEDFRAIDDIRAFLSWSSGAAAAGSTVEIALTQMAAYDGNINTAAIELFKNSKTADGSVTDTTLVAQITTDLGMVKLEDTSNTIAGVTTTGLAYSHYVRVRMTLNAINNYFKHMRIAGYTKR